MQNQKADINKTKSVFLKKEDEKILVVAREKLFKDKVVNGIEQVDFNYYQNLIEENKEFLWRSKMETDTNYKQIIPYLVFQFQDKFFLMRRKSNASEVRLQDKYSLGIGGHIREQDLSEKSIVDWAHREFAEEIDYSGDFKIEPIGLLNDDTNDVGKVHVGFVFLLKGNSSKINIHDEHKEGKLLTLQECDLVYSKMEGWSQIVFNYLKKLTSK